MAQATLWGVFGAIWILFAIDELGLGAAAIGIIAGLGGLSSLVGAAIAERVTRRLGVGPAAIASMLVATVGFALIPLAPAGLPVLAFGFLAGQQLIGDGAITLYDVAETSVRQARVHDRALGRVAATVQVGSVGAQLVAALGAGLLAEVIGLRATAFLAPLGTLAAAGILVWSPVRRLRELPALDGRSPAEVVVDVERDQPVGA
jgi:MFS family permease